MEKCDLLELMLCNADKESCDHLFVTCSESWKIWAEWCRLWGIMWISPGNVKELFFVWNKWQLVRLDARIWKMGFFAMVWSIWKSRNEIVFQGKKWNKDQVLELARIRVAYWANAKWPKDYPYVLDVYRQPPAKSKDTKKNKERK